MFRANIYEPLLYNFAAENYHTKKPSSRLYSIEIKLYLNKQKIAF